MIKQIVEFRREGEEGRGEIEYFFMAQTDEEMKNYNDVVKQLATESTIEYADGDTVRGVFKAATQEKLLDLLNDGWSFSEDSDLPEDLAGLAPEVVE